jgi:hypothetical protein
MSKSEEVCGGQIDTAARRGMEWAYQSHVRACPLLRTHTFEACCNGVVDMLCHASVHVRHTSRTATVVSVLLLSVSTILRVRLMISGTRYAYHLGQQVRLETYRKSTINRKQSLHLTQPASSVH